MSDVPTPSVPVMRPRLPRADEVSARLRAVDAAGWYTNFGSQEAELRARFAAFLGVDEDRVATAANATLALQGAATVGRADSWIVPSFTFPATPAAVHHAGCHMTFADVRPDDWWLDADRVSSAASAVGLVPVAPFGAPLDLGSWDPSAEVIIDAAASLGADLPPLQDLPATWAVVFSLHATKCLPAGEGGLVVFGDPQRADAFRAWTNFGLTRSREAVRIGTNAKLSEIAAAYAHASLDGWESIQAEWVAARSVAASIEERHGLIGQPGVRADVSPYWIVDLGDAATAARVERTLGAHGIGTRRWWSAGCHRMPAFADVHRGDLPVTESVSARTLGLPMFRGMDGSHAARISVALGAAGLPMRNP